MLPSHNCIIISNVQFSRCSLNLLSQETQWSFKFLWNFSQSLWWRVPGSNRWPPACKAGALPAELTPQIVEIKATFFNLNRASNLSCVFVSPLNFKPASLGFEVVFMRFIMKLASTKWWAKMDSLFCGKATPVATVHRTVAKSRLSSPVKISVVQPFFVSFGSSFELVGQNGLEPSTSRLSVVCSSQLSYWPISASLLI